MARFALIALLLLAVAAPASADIEFDTPRVAGTWTTRYIPLDIDTRDSRTKFKVQATCGYGACNLRVRESGAKIKMRLRNGEWRYKGRWRSPRGDSTDCVDRRGNVVAHRAYFLRQSQTMHVVRHENFHATRIEGVYTEEFRPNGRGKAHDCASVARRWTFSARRTSPVPTYGDETHCGGIYGTGTTWDIRTTGSSCPDARIVVRNWEANCVDDPSACGTMPECASQDAGYEHVYVTCSYPYETVRFNWGV